MSGWRSRSGWLVAATSTVLVCGAASANASTASPQRAAALGPVPDYATGVVPGLGTRSWFAPLSWDVIAAAQQDHPRVPYLFREDLGGFRPAPVGELPTVGGRPLVGHPNVAQIPQYGGTDGTVSFGPVGGTPTPTAPEIPESGLTPVPGPGGPVVFFPPGGAPPPITPAPTTTVTPGPVPTIPTTPPTSSPPTTSFPGAPTTTPPTTVPPTTVPPPTTTPTSTPPTTAPPPVVLPPESVSLTSDHGSVPLIRAFNMEPGQEAHELLTLGNAGTTGAQLSVTVVGTANQLWSDLHLLIADQDSGTTLYDATLVTSNGSLSLGALPAGSSRHLMVGLYLPLSAGNEDQGLAANLDLNWVAQS